MSEQRYDCAHCGDWLPSESRLGRYIRTDRRYCSDKCRYQAWKEEQPRPAEKSCRLCGKPFRPLRGNQSYCDLDEQADEACAKIQDARAKAALEARNDREDDLFCAHCEEWMEWSGRGRVPRFCAPRCRTAFYRAQRKAAANA
jgi:hypothetical protein